MALLSNPFILCPLTNPEEFLGISPSPAPLWKSELESDASGKGSARIIATLGKTICIKYNVPEQQQEASWISSSHWFTSKVIYIAEVQKYGVVLNDSIIGLWDEADSTLTYITKYKFREKLFELKSTQFYGTIAIFKNGHIASFNAIKNSTGNNAKEIPIKSVINIREKYQLISVTVDEKEGYIFLLFGHKMPDSGKTSSCGSHKLLSLKVFTLKLEKCESESVEMNQVIGVTEVETETNGYCIVADGNNSFMLFVGSDRILNKMPLISTAKSNAIRLRSLSKYISAHNPIVIKPLNTSIIAIYGPNALEEGGIVFIYDINYDLFLSKQSLKMCAFPPIMEYIGFNLFVPVGFHLLVLNCRIKKSLLSSVVGQTQMETTDCFQYNYPWTSAKGWELESATTCDKSSIKKFQLKTSSKHDQLVQIVDMLEKAGQTQASICTQIFKKIQEKPDLTTIQWVLNSFDDLSEVCLVQLLEILFKFFDEIQVSNSISNRITLEVIATQITEVLSCRFDDKLMILNSKSLQLHIVKRILKWLMEKFDQDWRIGTEAEVLAQSLKWISILLDSHYPQFVLDSEAELLTSIMVYFDQKSQLMEEIESVEPALIKTLQKVSVTSTFENSNYRREMIYFE